MKRDDQALFTNPDAVVLVAAPSLLEIAAALRIRMPDAERRRAIVELYGGRLAEVVPVDRAAALAAIRLRETAGSRLPATDALIAGCAVSRGATLVHRDPHFDGIASDALRTFRLSDTEPPAGETPAVVKESRGRYGKTARPRDHVTTRPRDAKTGRGATRRSAASRGS